MRGLNLNKLHRYVGITLAPFLVVQTFSGLLLEFGLFRRGAAATGLTEAERSRGALESLLVQVHFGAGLVSDCYHLLLGLAITWMAATGWLLYLRMRRVMKRSARTAATEVRK